LKKFDIIVIGAGASGMMAAGIAAENGSKVLLIEKMKYPGRKLRISGKGRCNITNSARMSEFIGHIHNGKFLRTAFTSFFNKELIDFLLRINIRTIEERGNRVFPESQDARLVTDAFHHWIVKAGVTLHFEAEVKQLLLESKRVKGIVLKNNSEYLADAVIIATGGMSYPATGSTGDGYDFAEKAGHSIIKLRPVLVPLVTKGPDAGQLEGLSLKNIRINVWVDGRKKAGEFGEMVFTRNGLSGPVILSLSREFIDDIRQKKNVIFSIDLKPALDDSTTDKKIVRDIRDHGKKNFSSLLKFWLPAKLVPLFMEKTGIHHDKIVSQINADERKKIRLLLKDFRFEVTGHSSFDDAIVTAGGVDVNEINPVTMESKLIENLYFAGEVLDLDADTGGYNLQIAFSTGWVAGKSSSLKTAGKSIH